LRLFQLCILRFAVDEIALFAVGKDDIRFSRFVNRFHQNLYKDPQ